MFIIYLEVYFFGCWHDIISLEPQILLCPLLDGIVVHNIIDGIYRVLYYLEGSVGYIVLVCCWLYVLLNILSNEF